MLVTHKLVLSVLFLVAWIGTASPLQDRTDQGLARRKSKNSDTSHKEGDPGIFPGGKKSYERDGWRLLPPVTGSKIDNTTFKMDDKGTVLTTYITENFDPKKIKRVIVQTHGQYRDAWNQWIYANLSLNDAVDNNNIAYDEVLLVAPMFYSVVDRGAYPVDSNNVSSSHTLIWDDNGWGDCEDAILPSYDSKGQLANPDYIDGKSSNDKAQKRSDSSTHALSHAALQRRSLAGASNAEAQKKGPGISILDVYDKLVDYFTDKRKFPNVEKIVLSGFSMGAQSVNRYLALRTDTSKDSKIFYVMSSPASFMYVDENRPNKVPKNCKDFNEYKYGLDGNMPNYYSRHKDGNSADDIRKRYLTRNQFYFVGNEDTSDADNSCGANTQGSGHVDRMQNWVYKELSELAKATNVADIEDTVAFHRVSKTTHDEHAVLSNDQVQKVLFQAQSAKELPMDPNPHNAASRSVHVSHLLTLTMAVVLIANTFV